MPAAGSHKDEDRLVLTHRQREVIELMARGMTNFEIGQALGISLEGAKYHVREILTRFGVDSREEAVAVWHAQRRPLARVAHAFAAIQTVGWMGRIAAAGAAVVACGAIAAAILVPGQEGSSNQLRHGLSPVATTAHATAPSTTASAPGSPAVSKTLPSKGPPVLWRWNTGNPHDMVWFGASPSLIAISVAPLTPGPGYVAALDASTGNERWRFATTSVPLPPVVTSKAVVFGTGSGTVYALDPSNGTKLWSVDFPGIPLQAVEATGAIVVADADPEVWGPGGLVDKTRLAGRVWGLDPATGKVLWKVETGTFDAFVTESGSTVVISTYDYRVASKTETMAVDSVTGERLWQAPTDGAETPPIIADGTVYMAAATGTLYALDVKTGRQLWTATPTSGGTYSFPFAAGGALLLPSNANTFEARNAANGSLLWKTDMPDCGGHPFAAGHTFTLMCGGIYTVDLNGSASGALKAWLQPQGEVQWVEPIPGGMLVSSYTGEGPVSLLALAVP